MERIVDGRAVGGHADPGELLAQLKDHHAQLEARLAELENHLALSPAEQVERARIKKLKLLAKDQMAAIAATLSRR
jgi:uncharacterized protein YdcH (DUF465 family)